MVKLKKNRELGVLTSGIKRDGHQKKSGNLEIRELEVPGIRRDDCISYLLALNIHLIAYNQRNYVSWEPPKCNLFKKPAIRDLDSPENGII